jgi:predicted dinucleotide-binding enzyme
MKLAIIGAGRLGTALAIRLEAAGHDLTVASRTIEDSERLVGGLARTRAMAPEAAVDGAEAVILAVRFADVAAALSPIAARLDGVVLWSCVNALTADFSGLAVGFDDSAAETVARQVPGARVVAALPPFADALAAGDLDYAGRSPTTFVCGDETVARTVVAGLLRDIGADPVDAGPLANARLVEPAMLLLVRLAYGAATPRDLALALLERR